MCKRKGQNRLKSWLQKTRGPCFKCTRREVVFIMAIEHIALKKGKSGLFYMGARIINLEKSSKFYVSRSAGLPTKWETTVLTKNNDGFPDTYVYNTA